MPTMSPQTMMMLMSGAQGGLGAMQDEYIDLGYGMKMKKQKGPADALTGILGGATSAAGNIAMQDLEEQYDINAENRKFDRQTRLEDLYRGRKLDSLVASSAGKGFDLTGASDLNEAAAALAGGVAGRRAEDAEKEANDLKRSGMVAAFNMLSGMRGDAEDALEDTPETVGQWWKPKRFEKPNPEYEQQKGHLDQLQKAQFGLLDNLGLSEYMPGFAAPRAGGQQSPMDIPSRAGLAAQSGLDRIAARSGGGTKESPPVVGAKKAADGKWYVEKNGQFYRVGE